METPGKRLREAREAAGITQSELAARSGVPQSNVSSYERGSRPMSGTMLDRLISAATMTTPSQRLRKHRAEVLRAIATAGVSEPAVFGSVAREEDHHDSDLDLLVTPGPETSSFDLVILRTQLEDILGCRVDVVSRGGLLAQGDHLVAGAVPL